MKNLIQNIFAIGLSLFVIGCNSQVPVDEETKTNDTTLLMDDFVPLISMDSLNKIEEELDEKIKAFEKETDSLNK